MPSSRIENRVSDLLADAREARDAGDWKTARTLLDAVGALDPGNAEAAAMMAGAATRRQMTLLFCDIVGSTELADGRDPEEVTAVIERYRAAVRRSSTSWTATSTTTGATACWCCSVIRRWTRTTLAAGCCAVCG